MAAARGSVWEDGGDMPLPALSCAIKTKGSKNSFVSGVCGYVCVFVCVRAMWLWDLTQKGSSALDPPPPPPRKYTKATSLFSWVKSCDTHKSYYCNENDISTDTCHKSTRNTIPSIMVQLCRNMTDSEHGVTPTQTKMIIWNLSAVARVHGDTISFVKRK